MIIKCPECGHQVSDKAPVCPSCGVEIAGKIVRCPHCGEIHFISDGICPNCHHSLVPHKPTAGEKREDTIPDAVITPPAGDTTDDEELADNSPLPDNSEDSLEDEKEIAKEEEEEESEPVQAVPITGTDNSARQATVIGGEKKPAGNNGKNTASGGKKGNTPGKQPAKKSHWPLVVSLIIAAVICLILLFAYKNANMNNEAREYQNAIESRDPGIMQSYLNTYTNAPQAHRDSVQALLNAIRSSDPAWETVKGSTDVNVLKQYLQHNPNSPHKQEILNRIDELDWKAALQTHDFANYLSLHQNGIHAAEAVDSVKLTMDMPASGADKQKAVSAVRSFLVAINSHNADRVKNCVASHLEYFNEKSSVGSDEAVNYMAIIYRDAEKLNWHVDHADDAKVTKTGSGSSTQYSISMPARLSVNYTSGNNVQAPYNIQAKVDASGHITAIRLIRQAESKTSSTSSSKSSESSSSENKASTSEKKSSSSEKKSSSSDKKSSSDHKSSDKKSSSSKSSAKKSDKKK